MSRLDFSRDYGTVYDMPGVRYQQNGRYFRHDGESVDEEPIAPAPQAEPVDARPRKDGMSDDDLRRPENRTLKAQIEVYGGEWTTRKDALEFLKGRQ